jgi:hypothetical protein
LLKKLFCQRSLPKLAQGFPIPIKGNEVKIFFLPINLLASLIQAISSLTIISRFSICASALKSHDVLVPKLFQKTKLVAVDLLAKVKIAELDY